MTTEGNLGKHTLQINKISKKSIFIKQIKIDKKLKYNNEVMFNAKRVRKGA